MMRVDSRSGAVLRMGYIPIVRNESAVGGIRCDAGSSAIPSVPSQASEKIPVVCSHPKPQVAWYQEDRAT